MLDLAYSLDALDRLGEGVFALDPEGRFTYLNHIARDLLPGLTGATTRDLLGTIIWGAGNETIPLAAGAFHGSVFQEEAIKGVGYSSAPTGLIALALILWGLRLTGA